MVHKWYVRPSKADWTSGWVLDLTEHLRLVKRTGADQSQAIREFTSYGEVPVAVQQVMEFTITDIDSIATNYRNC